MYRRRHDAEPAYPCNLATDATIKSSLPRRQSKIMVASIHVISLLSWSGARILQSNPHCRVDVDVYDICQFGVWIIVIIVQYGNNMPNAVINVFTTINNRKGRSDDKSGGQCQWYKKYDIEEDNSYTRTIRRRRRMCTKRMRADDKKEENPGFCYYFWIITCWLMSFLWYYILCLILLQVQIIKHASNHVSAYGCVVIDVISEENVCGQVNCNNVMDLVDVDVHDDDDDRSERQRHEVIVFISI